MHWIDWAIVFVPLFVVVYIGLKCQRYIKGVSDFLTAGRVAGRYVVAVSGGEAAMEKVKCPVLFVLGSADQMAPPKGAQSLTKLAPTARTAMVPAGHQMMVEARSGRIPGAARFPGNLDPGAAGGFCGL